MGKRFWILVSAAILLGFAGLVWSASEDANPAKHVRSLLVNTSGEAVNPATAALLGAGLPAALGAGGGLKIDGSGTAVPVVDNAALGSATPETSVRKRVALSTMIPQIAIDLGAAKCNIRLWLDDGASALRIRPSSTDLSGTALTDTNSVKLFASLGEYSRQYASAGPRYIIVYADSGTTGSLNVEVW